MPVPIKECLEEVAMICLLRFSMFYGLESFLFRGKGEGDMKSWQECLRNVPANGDHNGLWKQWDRVLLYCRTIKLCFYVLEAKTNLSEGWCVAVVKLIHGRRYSRMLWHVTSFEICSIFRLLGNFARQFREAALRFFMSLCASFRRLSAWNN